MTTFNTTKIKPMKIVEIDHYTKDFLLIALMVMIFMCLSFYLGMKYESERNSNLVKLARYDCNIFSNNQWHQFKDCKLTKAER